MTWLIAEDEADIRNLVALMCQAWGHIPLAFENGQRVWDWLDSIEQGTSVTVPELILMDIRMPGKKGNELAHRMRQLSVLEGTPIVLMTAYTLSDSERQEMITNDGVDLILAKPLPDFDQLRTILHNVGDKKKANRVGEHAPIPAQETQEAASTSVTAAAPTTSAQSADESNSKPTLIGKKKKADEAKAAAPPQTASASEATLPETQPETETQTATDSNAEGGKQASS